MTCADLGPHLANFGQHRSMLWVTFWATLGPTWQSDGPNQPFSVELGQMSAELVSPSMARTDSVDQLGSKSRYELLKSCPGSLTSPDIGQFWSMLSRCRLMLTQVAANFGPSLSKSDRCFHNSGQSCRKLPRRWPDFDHNWSTAAKCGKDRAKFAQVGKFWIVWVFGGFCR